MILQNQKLCHNGMSDERPSSIPLFRFAFLFVFQLRHEHGVIYRFEIDGITRCLPIEQCETI